MCRRVGPLCVAKEAFRDLPWTERGSAGIAEKCVVCARVRSDGHFAGEMRTPKIVRSGEERFLARARYEEELRNLGSSIGETEDHILCSWHCLSDATADRKVGRPRR